MEGKRGRASYRTDKGVGYLDPGSVTMAYQIETFSDYMECIYSIEIGVLNTGNELSEKRHLKYEN